MDKLKLAHDYFMKHAGGSKCYLGMEVKVAWEYADAMQAEADSRVNKERPDVLQERQDSLRKRP